jgi:hypothetical protein
VLATRFCQRLDHALAGMAEQMPAALASGAMGRKEQIEQML